MLAVIWGGSILLDKLQHGASNCPVWILKWASSGQFVKNLSHGEKGDILEMVKKGTREVDWGAYHGKWESRPKKGYGPGEGTSSRMASLSKVAGYWCTIKGVPAQ